MAARRGAIDTFAIVNHHDPNNGIVNTAEDNYQDGIKTDQPWMRESPVGDWCYGPNFNYDSCMVPTGLSFRAQTQNASRVRYVLRSPRAARL